MKKRDNEFGVLFGVEPAQIRSNCVLMPMMPKGVLSEFGIKDLSKGRLFHAASSKNLTVIHCGIGAGFAGDAVLYLKATGCRNLFLFGSCGLVRQTNGLKIASLVSPFKCLSFESFSEMLLPGRMHPKAFYPDRALNKKFLAFTESKGVTKVKCATLGSLKLEQEMRVTFERSEIEAVDMECSAFFSAASYCGLRALALFYVSDVIKEKPFYEELEPDLKSKLSSAISDSARLLCEFIEKNSSG